MLFAKGMTLKSQRKICYYLFWIEEHKKLKEEKREQMKRTAFKKIFQNGWSGYGCEGMGGGGGIDGCEGGG